MSNTALDAFLRSLLAADATLPFDDLVIEISCEFDLDKEDAVTALTGWFGRTKDAVLRQEDADDQGEVSLVTDDDDDDGWWEACIEAERASETALFGDWT